MIIKGVSWRSVLLVEETGVPGENHRSAASHYNFYNSKVIKWQIVSYQYNELCLLEDIKMF
jgi:hypothetical protein